MTQETVRVRAEQRFEGWDYGEERTVPRDKFIEKLIENGRLTVLADTAPSADESPSEYDVPEHLGIDPDAGPIIPFVDASDAVNTAAAESQQAQADLIEARGDAAVKNEQNENEVRGTRRRRTRDQA